jgi:hypothetical protein
MRVNNKMNEKHDVADVKVARDVLKEGGCAAAALFPRTVLMSAGVSKHLFSIKNLAVSRVASVSILQER